MSHINFSSISGRVVSANYDLPADTNVVVVNNTSGQALASPVTPVSAGHNGTLKVDVPANVPGGDYYLKALDKSGEWVAQSVVFEIA